MARHIFSLVVFNFEKVTWHLYSFSNTKYGENIWRGQGKGVKGPVKSWYDEKAKYNYNKPGHSSQTGHFTQVVWKGSTQLGVGMAKGKGGTTVVAAYNQGGNMRGQFKQNVMRGR